MTPQNIRSYPGGMRPADERLAEGQRILNRLATGPWREIKRLMAEADRLLEEMDAPGTPQP